MAGRPKNAFKSATVTISTPPQIKQCLEKLVSHGVFGQSPSEVAKSLIEEEIKRLVREGTFLEPPDLIPRP
jgi:hypothetical protein